MTFVYFKCKCDKSLSMNAPDTVRGRQVPCPGLASYMNPIITDSGQLLAALVHTENYICNIEKIGDAKPGFLPAVIRRPSLGFSLVEVTLALMVMAVGILSVMSLFPAGLDQNLRSIADTHAAFFAEEVFAGLQACAESNWDGLANAQLPVAASDMWSNMTNKVHVTEPNVVMNKYEYISSGIHYDDHALRYRLVVTTNGLLKAATLYVWPGEFGSTNDPGIFYAEFFRFRP